MCQARINWFWERQYPAIHYKCFLAFWKNCHQWKYCQIATKAWIEGNGCCQRGVTGLPWQSVTNKKLDCHRPVFEKQEPVCSHEVLITIVTESGTLFWISKFICKSYEVWLWAAASLLKPYHRLSTSTTWDLLLYMSALLKCYVIYFCATQLFADLFLYVPVHKLYFINYNYLSVFGWGPFHLIGIHVTRLPTITKFS